MSSQEHSEFIGTKKKSLHVTSAMDASVVTGNTQTNRWGETWRHVRRVWQYQRGIVDMSEPAIFSDSLIYLTGTWIEREEKKHDFWDYFAKRGCFKWERNGWTFFCHIFLLLVNLKISWLSLNLISFLHKWVETIKCNAIAVSSRKLEAQGLEEIHMERWGMRRLLSQSSMNNQLFGRLPTNPNFHWELICNSPCPGRLAQFLYICFSILKQGRMIIFMSS